MIKIGEECSAEYSVKFNSARGSLLLFNTTTADVVITLNGEIIPLQHQAVHLDSCIGHNYNECYIQNAIREIFTRTNIQNAITEIFTRTNIQNAITEIFTRTNQHVTIWVMQHYGENRIV